MKRKYSEYGLILLKGVAMGAADVVPGVSGGTIAFITGIYDELLESIKSINTQSLKLLVSGKPKQFWKAVNGNFLLCLVAGIGLSIFSLARIITLFLDSYPVLVWAFFFGLIAASTLFVAKEIRDWNWKNAIGFAAGIGIALYITSTTPANTPETLPFIFLCGFIAICAMILPGISGSFILLLMGKYSYIMAAVKHLDPMVLGIFGIGAVCGIATFSRLLSYALHRFRNLTLAVLTGFMLGSLNKVWPWKQTVSTYTDSHGVEKALTEINVAPDGFIWQAVILATAGFLLVWGIERIAPPKTR